MSGISSPGGRTPHCPTCEAELRYERGDVPAYLCPAGHGVAATLPATRQHVDEEVVNKVWGEAYRAPAGLRPCPFCTEPMTPVTWTLDPTDAASKVELDLCREDQLLWFDVGELEKLPEAQRVDEDDDELVISHAWANAADNLPSWTQRVVGRGLVRGVGGYPPPPLSRFASSSDRRATRTRRKPQRTGHFGHPGLASGVAPASAEGSGEKGVA